MMPRRSLLKLLGACAVSAGTPVAARPLPVLIYDGRFPAARALAAHAVRAHDCRHDAALLWQAQFADRPLPLPVIGLTTWADAMVIADFARREGYRLACLRPSSRRSNLRLWRLG